MKKIHDNQYSQFTPNERLNLTLAALSRADEVEANRLWETCPRYKYEAYDFEYTLSFDALMILNSIFFEMCVFRYNLIKKLDEFILEAELDLAHEKKNQKNDANPSKKLTEDIQLSRNRHISKIKGLFEGFKLFCSEVNLYYENVINQISISKCCHELDFLLNSEIEPNMQYATQVKLFFKDHWNFKAI